MRNHAAYTARDVDDARRGPPASDLTSYGRARGLEPLGQALVGHMSGLNPLWIDYVFNVLRGELVPGRFGTVQHELDEVELGDDGQPRQGGTYFGRRSNAKPGLRSLIGLRKEAPNQPFAAQAMWLPTTSIKVLVPEASLLPRLRLLTKDHMVWTEPALRWAPSFGMVSDKRISPELREAVAAAVGPTLQTLDAAFVRLELLNGALGLRVDGFRADSADIDRLVAATAVIADALANLARPWSVPGPFELPLGSFDESTHPPGYRTFHNNVERSGLQELQQAAASKGMAIEDPVMLHRRIPRLRLPGTSMGVLGGALPGTSTFGRLTWQNQSHPGSSSYLRPAAVVAAAPDAPSTPVGGILLKATDMYVVVADGLACCWTRTNSVGRLAVDDLAARAVESLRHTGAIRPEN